MTLKNPKETARKLGVLALVVVLVTQPMAMPALAASGTPDEDGFAGDDCGRSAGELAIDVLQLKLDKSEKCEDLEEKSNMTHGTVYENALLSNDFQNSTNTVLTNHLDGLETSAQTIVDKEIDYAMRNNLTLTEAKANINDSLEDYYVTRQQNLIEAHNTTVLNLWYLQGRVYAVDSTGSERMILQGEDDYDNGEIYDESLKEGTNSSDINVQRVTNTTTLIDGNTTEFEVVRLEDTSGNAQGWKMMTAPFAAVTGTQDYTEEDGYGDVYYATDPTAYDGTGIPDSANATVLYHENKWRTSWTDIEAQHDRVVDNAMLEVEGIYSEYNYSEWTTQVSLEALGADFLAQEYATKRNSTGYYSYAAASLGLIGVSGDYNNSFAIEYTPDGDTRGYEPNGTVNLSGQVLTNWKPNQTDGTFETGVVYDTDNADGPVYFAAQFNNSSQVVDLDGEFVIQNLTNVQTGEEVNSTTLDDRADASWNSSLTIEDIRKLQEYNEDQIDAADSETGVGSGGFDFGNVSPLGAGVGALVGLALVVVLGKEFAS